MSQVLTEKARIPVLRDAAIGFCGKLPARGDFVRLGVPRGFAEPWDEWMARMLMASRSALGAAWRPAWLEAPVWRFALAPGICGPDAAIGLWMPSVDRIGRYFPLTIAAVALHGDIRVAMREGAGFLAAAEEIGRDALARDLVPDEIAAHLADAATRAGADPHAELSRCSWEGALWWTKGAPRVSAGVFASTALPGEEAFAAMLSACALTSPAFGRERSR